MDFEIKIYFDYFLKFKPCGKITKIFEDDLGYRRTAIVNGIYVFDLVEDGVQTQAPARFTFEIYEGKRREIEIPA